MFIEKPHSNFGNIFKILIMKTLRLLFTSLTLCLVFMCQSNAQTIRNVTTCSFNVKANVIATGTCALTGLGPVFPGVGPGAVIPVPLPIFPPNWVPAYGVKRPFTPPVLVGDPACGYIASRFVGFCGGAPAFATYDPATSDVLIHF